MERVLKKVGIKINGIAFAEGLIKELNNRLDEDGSKLEHGAEYSFGREFERNRVEILLKAEGQYRDDSNTPYRFFMLVDRICLNGKWSDVI